MAEIEMAALPAAFGLIRTRRIRIAPANPPDLGGTILVVEQEDEKRTGRWMACEAVLSDEEFPRVVGLWPPIAMNNNPNPAAARIPIGGQS